MWNKLSYLVLHNSPQSARRTKNGLMECCPIFCNHKSSKAIPYLPQHIKLMNSKYLQVQLMLVIDAFLTLITWLPYQIFSAVYESSQSEIQYTPEEIEDIVRIHQILTILMLTNTFSTPIVYFIFNRNFRVSLFVCFFIYINKNISKSV